MPKIFLITRFTPTRIQEQHLEFESFRKITPFVNPRTIDEAVEDAMEEIQNAVGETKGSIVYQMAALANNAPLGCYIRSGLFEKADIAKLMHAAIAINERAIRDEA